MMSLQVFASIWVGARAKQAIRRAVQSLRSLRIATKLALAVFSFLCATESAAYAFTFPPNLAPPAPFPLILANGFDSEFVAPGVTYARYVITTSSGPIVVTALAVDPREPTIHFNTVLAADRLISGAETPSAMALRTGAVAGINADYFDIGNTNQPLGIVVRDGTLVRSPDRFAALAITKSGSAFMGVMLMNGSVTYGSTTLALTGVNEWPPQGGASLITPALGNVPPEAGITRARLEPLTSPPDEQRFRVTALEDGLTPASSISALALGPATSGSPAPHVGDLVSITYTIDPPLDDLQAAVSGGPLLVKDGQPFDDPVAPAPGEDNKRFPVSGAARLADGTILFLEVDGRQPAYSIGLTRPEMGALMRGFGATDGMAFDSGGSATLVARRLGDASASVRNTPSDGRERPVADGLFVYSDAPQGPPARLVVRPEHAWMLAKSSIDLWTAVTDNAGHLLSSTQAAVRGTTLPAGVARLQSDGHLVAAATRASGILHVHRGALESDVLVDVVPSIDRLTIVPAHPNPDPGAHLDLHAIGYDNAGHAIILGDKVTWHASGGTIDREGRFIAGRTDASIEAVAPGTRASLEVPVGRHLVALPIFNEHPEDAQIAWTFSSVPANGPGFARTNEDCALCLALGYDFTQGERIVLAAAPLTLSGDPIGLSIEILGDGSGTSLRAAFLNGAGERFAVIIAHAIDWKGWQRREVHFPPHGSPPVRLIGFSLVALQKKAAGMIGLRSARILLAGSKTPAPLFTVPRSSR